MYSKLMVPIDLSHTDRLEKALGTAAELARTYDAEIVYVGVSTVVPSSAAHSPAEFGEKLDQFAFAEAKRRDVTARAETVVSHDVSIDLGDKLIEAANEMGADAIVMASHVPGLAEHIFASKAGYVASHAPISVFVIR